MSRGNDPIRELERMLSLPSPREPQKPVPLRGVRIPAELITEDWAARVQRAKLRKLKELRG